MNFKLSGTGPEKALNQWVARCVIALVIVDVSILLLGCPPNGLLTDIQDKVANAKVTTYTVTYNGNRNTGGSVPVDGRTYHQGETVTVLDNTGVLVKTHCNFAGWSTQADGGTTFLLGKTFVMGNTDVTLYAVWAPSTNADLSALTISAGQLSPNFSPGVTSYTDSVAYSVSKVTVTPTAAEAGATIQVRVNSGTWQDLNSGFPSGYLDLNVGPNSIDVKVTAADNTITKGYNVGVTRANASPDLSALTISAGQLSPNFSPGVTSYTDSVAYSVSKVTVTPTAAEAGATIQVQVNGGGWQIVSSGKPSQDLVLTVSPPPPDNFNNVINLEVTAADGTTKRTYSIAIQRPVCGSLDTDFANSTVTTSNAIAVQDNGYIVVGGSVSSSSGVIRLKPDGSLDTPILSSVTLSAVNALALQTDGKILVGGSFSYIIGTGPYYNGYNIIRANPDGSFDSSFLSNGGGPNGIVKGIAVQGSEILVGGTLDTYRVGLTPTTVDYMVRLYSDGTLDKGFWPTANATGPDWTVNTVVLYGGNIYIGGAFTSYAGWRGGAVRLTSEGVYDIPGPGFMANDLLGANGVRSLAVQQVQPDVGKIVLGGDFTTYGNVTRNRIIRVNVDGTLDVTFGNSGDGANGSVCAVVLQADGRILIGGEFTTYNGTIRNHIARLNSDGTIDDSFLGSGGGTDGPVYTLAVQKDGMILIGGSFTHYKTYSTNSTACSGIIRVRPDD